MRWERGNASQDVVEEGLEFVSILHCEWEGKIVCDVFLGEGFINRWDGG